MRPEFRLETDHKPRLRRFLGLFWPLFDSFCEGSIRKLIQPPQKEFENRLKRTQKSTEAGFVVSLLGVADGIMTP